jgi:hypothetical protein
MRSPELAEACGCVNAFVFVGRRERVYLLRWCLQKFDRSIMQQVRREKEVHGYETTAFVHQASINFQ